MAKKTGKKIYRIEDMPLDAQVYLKKDWLGWRTVDPIFDKEGKPIEDFSQFKNMRKDKGNYYKIMFGSKRAAVSFLIMIIVIAALLFAFNGQIAQFRNVAKHPCEFCPLVNQGQVGSVGSATVNFSQLNGGVNNGG